MVINLKILVFYYTLAPKSNRNLVFLLTANFYEPKILAWRYYADPFNFP